MTAARRFYVTFESGLTDIVEADDAVEAVAIAQRRGSVRSVASDPQQVSGFGWLAKEPQ